MKQEAGWLGRQKLKMTVDLTSGLNLYPDLRIVNNDPPFYQKSMEAMKGVIDKMEILGADELLISTQRTIENNYTMEQFYASLKESFQVLSDYAAKKNIRLLLRQSVGRTPDTIEGLQKLVGEVNRPNFTLAPALSLLLNNEVSLDADLNRLKQMEIKEILISAPERIFMINCGIPMLRYINPIKQHLSVKYWLHSRRWIISWMVCMLRRMKSIWMGKRWTNLLLNKHLCGRSY